MSTAAHIYETVVADLADAIGETRDDVDAGELARALLDWEGGHRSLVGLSEGCRRATFYDETVAMLHAFPVPEGELSDRGEIESTTAEGRPVVYAHVAERAGEGWCWLHPRYRWVLDVADAGERPGTVAADDPGYRADDD